MVDLDIINGTIAEWEAKDLTFVVVERLAWLYIVRDHILMNSTDKSAIYSQPMPEVADVSESEFIRLAKASTPAHLWTVMDELMESVRMLQPRLYDAAIQELKDMI